MKYPIHNLLWPDAPVMFGPDINLPMTMMFQKQAAEANAVGVFPNPFHGRLVWTNVKHSDDHLEFQTGNMTIIYACTWRSKNCVYYTMRSVIHRFTPERRIL